MQLSNQSDLCFQLSVKVNRWCLTEECLKPVEFSLFADTFAWTSSVLFCAIYCCFNLVQMVIAMCCLFDVLSDVLIFSDAKLACSCVFITVRSSRMTGKIACSELLNVLKQNVKC